MSIKINKNDKEYPLGFVPQSLYDTIAELSEDSGWLETTSLSGNTVKYRKIGNLVAIRRGTTASIQTNTETTIGTLPTGFRPIANAGFGVRSEQSGTAQINVSTNGNVSIVSSANFIPAYYCTFFAD